MYNVLYDIIIVAVQWSVVFCFIQLQCTNHGTNNSLLKRRPTDTACDVHSRLVSRCCSI